MHPDQFARLCVQRDNVAPRANRCIEHAANFKRRRFKSVFRSRSEIVGLETPGDLKIIEVRGADLIERRIARR
jgi:hypothetical protein